jgi:arylsulfatase A-like enzyme
MNRRNFLKTVSLAYAGLSVAGCNSRYANTVKQPNVILIITDDQGYGDLACHGNPIIKTPALDQLHAESTRLTNFHVGPTCAPTRASLMTGRYCNRTGVWHTIMGRSLLRKDEKTMADVFAENGYQTGFFGKWHLGDNYPFRPEDRGFQQVVRHGGGGITQTPDYWGNDYFDDTYFHNNGVTKKYKGYCTDVWFDLALKFIELNIHKPFFCYLATNAPHGPFNVPPKYKAMYENVKKVPNAAFYGMITNIDDNINRLNNQLKKLRLVENTILIFMTDNGTAAGHRNGGFNAGMRGNKGSEYDGGHRVPFFIRWPNGTIQSGKDINRITAHVDVLPTLIDLCSFEHPKGVEFDGSSLKPLLLAEEITWPNRVLITDSQRLENPQKWRKSAVMTDRWRLVNGVELYDMTTDPGQQKNIAAQHPVVQKKLRKEYEKWWTSVSGRFDEYCPIILGSEHENPICLTGHDWHDPTNGVAWQQSRIRDGIETWGFWAVEIERSGTYQIEFRRWPIEENAPINAAVAAIPAIPGSPGYENGVTIPVDTARLKIQNIDQKISVNPDDVAARFQVKLKAGETTLNTWFMNKGKSIMGAYFVYVEFLQ